MVLKTTSPATRIDAYGDTGAYYLSSTGAVTKYNSGGTDWT